MPSPSVDFSYLERIDALDPANVGALLLEPKFLNAQEDLQEVIHELHGTLDADILDMRETHILAALQNPENLRVLDVGCGSPEAYVIEPDDFRNRYPPLLAEALTKRGAIVDGIDYRKNPLASYSHRVADLTDPLWKKETCKPYDLIACLSVFNAPGSPFLQHPEFIHAVLQEIPSLLSAQGLFVATLPENLCIGETVTDAWKRNIKAFLTPFGLQVVHIGRSMVWASLDRARDDR